MTISTLCNYLLGRRSAILETANQPRLLELGLLFVFSAGFAREYDAEDLLHEPWFLLIPLVASVVSSLLLFLIVRAFFTEPNKNFSGNPLRYRIFLGLYWMTAPLAWIYALPVERFLSAGDAIATNLTLLGIVSFWRVALIARVISVLYRCSYWVALFVVMLFADGLVMVVLYLTPLPVFNIMGGIHLSEGERIIQETAFTVGFFGVLSFPLWLIGSAIGLASFRRQQSLGTPPPLQSIQSQPIGARLWLLAIASLLVWCSVLPMTQLEQQNRHQIERLFQEGQLHTAMEMMSSLKLVDFPPYWDAPPHLGYGQRSPSLANTIDATISSKSVPWVQEMYLEKMRQYISKSAVYSRPSFGLDTIGASQLARFAGLLESRPDYGPELAASLRSEITRLVEREPERIESDDFSLWRKSIDRLLQLAQQDDGEDGSLAEMTEVDSEKDE